VRAAGLARTANLERRKPTTKPKCVFSVKSHAKRKFSIKIKLLGAYIRRRKQKGKRGSLRAIQGLGLSLRGKPLFLVIPLFLTTSHPTLSSISL